SRYWSGTQKLPPPSGYLATKAEPMKTGVRMLARGPFPLATLLPVATTSSPTTRGRRSGDLSRAERDVSPAGLPPDLLLQRLVRGRHAGRGVEPRGIEDAARLTLDDDRFAERPVSHRAHVALLRIAARAGDDRVLVPARL